MGEEDTPALCPREEGRANMKHLIGLLLVVLNVCLSNAEDLTGLLQSELKQFQNARQAIQNATDLSQADKLRKIFVDETIKRLYNKYPAFPSATWGSYVADLEKELKSVERKYKVPRFSPGADESMIEILEPTLAQLKKEYEGLGKKDAKRKELKKRIDDLQSQLDNHRSQAKAEKEKWENKSAKIVAERDAALTKIAEKVNGELDAFAEVHYLMPIKKLKEKDEQARKELVARMNAEREAEAKRAESLKEVRNEAMRQKLEPIYKKAKAWYDEQLRYNDMSETFYSLTAYSAEREEVQLNLDGPGFHDSYQIFLGDGYINYPRSMAKGFAEELVNARTIIHKYEHPNWFEESQEKIKQWQREKAEEKWAEAQKTDKRSSAMEDGARSRMGERRQKRKSGGRKINPNLKRFKGPND